MKIRIMGTKDECERIVKDLDKIYQIRNVSDFYENRGKSIEGRVYLEVEKSNKKSKKAKNDPKMQRGKCCMCGTEDDVAGTAWSGSEYANYCPRCMRKYVEQQGVGFELQKAYPDIYQEMMYIINRPTRTIVYNSGNDWMAFQVPDNGTGDLDDDWL